MREVERIWGESRKLIDQAKQSPSSPQHAGGSPGTVKGSPSAEATVPSDPAPIPTPNEQPAGFPPVEAQFSCPHCGQHLVVEAASSGTKVRCPACQNEMAVPRAQRPRPHHRFGVDLRNPAEAEVLKKILLSKEGTKALFGRPTLVEEIEEDMPVLLLASGISGALIGIWTSFRPEVSVVRDVLGRELWPGHSLSEHMCGGILLGLFCGAVLYFVTRPLTSVFRSMAGSAARDRSVRFACGRGRFLVLAAGGLIGALWNIGSSGSVLREGFGLFFRANGERGFLTGGLLGVVGFALSAVLWAKVRQRRRGKVTGEKME